MNILFLTIGTLNDVEERGLYTDLIRKFRDEGHSVFVANPREKRLNQETELIKEKGVTFLRVKIGNLTKTNLIEKGVATLRIEGQFLKAIQKYFSDIKFDLVLYSTPPITFEKVITYIKKRDQAKSYLLLKDIFPQNAVDLGMFSEKSVFNKYFTYKEKKLYSNSDYIGCMSPANVDFVVQHNPEIDANIVEVCPNSIEPMSIQIEDSTKKAIREKYNIPVDKIVFIYGGNLGKPQGIDFLIDCLKANVTDLDIYFVIAGSGTEYKKLSSFFETEKPKNAQLFSQLPKNDYELLANSCDVGLIFLDNRFTIPNFPSRLLSYMQASMPVLAATDVNTDIGRIIEEGQFGYWCESRQVGDFNKGLHMFKNRQLRKQIGENARQYLEENYTVQHSYDIIMKHFK
ncbi:glycosyltransferase family 4 protein [Metasolibacillus sp. FSL H7-0170]|uniref:glycosyltransferase family 4 protein n=1 Tax=Metasolibacillus sp. FSL H7-0170 TaxID=2921431 RepID=UPI0031596642